MKRCKVCGQYKPLSEFHRAAGMRDGHRNECKPCFRAINNERNARDPEKHRAWVAKWQRENYERYRARQREYRKRPDRRVAERNAYLKRKYGITVDEYDVMLEAQGGVCAICKEPRPEERTLHVDHDHETGDIRGLLCFRCNNAIGDLRDNPALVAALLTYLERDDELAACARERAHALRVVA